MSIVVGYTPIGRPWEPVRIDLVFANETWMVTDPMTRIVAERALRVIGEQGTPVLGQHVRQALIVPIPLEELLAL